MTPSDKEPHRSEWLSGLDRGGNSTRPILQYPKERITDDDSADMPRYYATGSFLHVAGDFVGVDQSTTSRIVGRVMDALLKHIGKWIHMPSQEEADRQKIKFHGMRGFQNVFGCINGTYRRLNPNSTSPRTRVCEQEELSQACTRRP